MTIINQDINFLKKRNTSSIDSYTKCLKEYSKNFDKEISFKTQSPIFLDTNVLLRYYTISFTARKKLFDFIKKYRKRIIISNQVQQEFLSNRESVIEQFFEQVSNRIPRDFKNDIVNKMKSFLDNHKTVLKDYPFVEMEINKYQTELESLMEKLNENSDGRRKEFMDLIVNDEFLDLLRSCNLDEGLEAVELEIVKKDFDLLSKDISSDNIDSYTKKVNFAFPGLGDIKNKPENPYGDFIIYHEIMKYNLKNNCNAIFITFDNAKGDWMSKTKTPYIHYVNNMFENTGQLIFILDADRSLGEILKVNIDSLINFKNELDVKPTLSVDLLENLFTTHEIFINANFDNPENWLVEELKLAGYNTIQKIRKDLTKGFEAFSKYQSNNSTRFNTIGILRITLRIVNKNYKQNFYRDGSTDFIPDYILNEYQTYRKYLKS